MYVFITILIIIVCVLLMLIVLIQNPKGGGLTASLGSIGNQMMGARKTTDFLEKSTWTLAIVLLALSLLAGFFVPTNTQETKQKSQIEEKMKEGNMPSSNMPTEPLNIPNNNNNTGNNGQ